MIVRELAMKLGLDVDAASFTEGNIAAGLVSKGMEKLGQVVQSVIEYLPKLVDAQAQNAKALHETAQIVGVTTEELQRLDRAALMTGVSTETLHHGMQILSRTMAAAKDGGKEQAAVFSKMGISIKGADGHLRSAGDVLGDLADHFKSLPDGAEKTAAAMKVLGRSGAELIPMLNAGGAELERLGAAATVMTERQIEAGRHLVLTQQKLAIVNAAAGKQIANGILPAVDRLVEKYYLWRKASVDAMRPKIAEFVEVLTKGIDFLGRAFDYVTAHAQRWGKMLAIAAAAGGAALLYKMIATKLIPVLLESAYLFAMSGGAGAKAFLAAGAPVAALAALVATAVLAVEDLWAAWEGGKSVITTRWPEVGEMFAQWKAQGKGFWQGLTDDGMVAFKQLLLWFDDELTSAFNATFGKVFGAVRSKLQDENELLIKKAEEIQRRHVAAGDTGYTFAQGMATAKDQYKPTAYAANWKDQYARRKTDTPEEAVQRHQNFIQAAKERGAIPQTAPVTSVGGGGRTTIVHNTKHVTVHANGVDPAGVVRAIEEHARTTNEETHAALGGNEP